MRPSRPSGVGIRLATLGAMRPLFHAATFCLLALSAACSRPADLVLYCSLDQDLSEPLIARFEEQSGYRVDTQFDVERNKTVGLVNRILQEAKNPRADVYWNNELAQTIRLVKEGVTEPFAVTSAEGIPTEFHDPNGHWVGFAARARVILYRTDRPDDMHLVPQRLEDFLRPEVAAVGAMAAPLTGTTLTNYSILADSWGDEQTIAWFEQAREAGLSFGSGNADVMRRTRNGDFLWCFTDTDDAAKAMDAGYAVAQRYLEQGTEAAPLGTLLIPNSVCRLASGKNQEAAQAFLEYVLSAETEQFLARSVSRQIPLHASVTAPPGVGKPGEDFLPMEVDWTSAAEGIQRRAADFQELFVR